MRTYRENPNRPINHDWFKGAKRINEPLATIIPVQFQQASFTPIVRDTRPPCVIVPFDAGDEDRRDVVFDVVFNGRVIHTAKTAEEAAWWANGMGYRIET